MEHETGGAECSGSATVESSDQEKAPRCRRPPIIAGVGPVLAGSLPASESVRIFGVHPPRYLFYMVSGAACDVIQLFIDLAIHHGLGVTDPSACWAASFALSVAARHTSHRYLVFGRFVGGYWNSLARMYGGYSFIIVLSTLFNWVVTRSTGMAHYFAWVLTLLWTGVANYFILKKLWSFGGKSEGGDGKDKSEGESEKQRKGNVRAASSADLEKGRAKVPSSTSRGKEALTSRRAIVV